MSYAVVLVKGSDEDAKEGLTICAKARQQLKDRHRMQRAKLWWTEGLLHHRLGDLPTAWWALDIARRSLIALKAAPEVGAVIADMARISPKPLAVAYLCEQAEAVISASHPLANSLQALAEADEGSLKAAAMVLRESAADQLSESGTAFISAAVTGKIDVREEAA